MEGNEFYIALLAKQVALEKTPGSLDTASYSMKFVNDAIFGASREVLQRLAYAAFAEAKGYNPFDETEGDTYMMDSAFNEFGELESELDALKDSSGPKESKIKSFDNDVIDELEEVEEDWDDAMEE